MASKEILFFYGTCDIYSQFHPATFTVDDVSYTCCEQYMMHQKAVLFGDDEHALKILMETEPRKIKAFGRQVRNFDDKVWVEKCRDIVFKGNLAKFSQNEHLKEALLKTGDRVIAEASPSDRRWGIGLSEKDWRSQDPSQWRGSNWLGEAIMRVRQNLREEQS